MNAGWALPFLSMIPFMIAASWANADAIDFTPTECAAQLRESTIFQGGQIRGVAISKIVRAFENVSEQGLGVRYEGFIFGHEPDYRETDGDYVDFRRMSFRTVMRFFDDLKRANAGGSEKTISALEAGFVQYVGAVVYGRTAMGLSRILSEYRRSSSSAPLDILQQVKPGKNGAPNMLTIDFRRTPGTDFRRFVELAESADPYVVGEYGPEVKRWIERVNQYLLEAKAGDVQAPAIHP